MWMTRKKREERVYKMMALARNLQVIKRDDEDLEEFDKRLNRELFIQQMDSFGIKKGKKESYVEFRLRASKEFAEEIGYQRAIEALRKKNG